MLTTPQAQPAPQPPSLPTLEQVEAELLCRSLQRFVVGGWHVLEPATAFVPNWHIDAICEHLEAVTAGEIRRLLINIPPGHMKSLTMSVFWPAWVWTQAPEVRWLFTSFAQPLSTRDSVKMRRLIQSEWYQLRWGDKYTLMGDQNAKTRYENSARGYRIATSMEAGTGERADVVAADDPHNIRKAESKADREGVLSAWDTVFSQRLSNPETGALVVTMQRLHEQDVSGHVLEQGEGQWEHLMLPAEYDPARSCVTCLGFEDPRSEELALLWPQRFNRKRIARMKIELGLYGAAGQLQQRPAPKGGGMFERAWFRLAKAVPDNVLARVRYWDKAGTLGGGKYTAGVLLAMTSSATYYVEDVVRGQWDKANREPILRATADNDAVRYGVGAVVHWVEQEPGSGGKDSATDTIINLAGHTVKAETASGDKFVRAGPLAAAAKVGSVHVLDGQTWTKAFLDEMELAGPGAAFLDQMDGASGAFNKLALDPQYAAASAAPDTSSLTSPSYWKGR